MGLPVVALVERHTGYGALAVTADERLVWSRSAAPILTNISAAAA